MRKRLLSLLFVSALFGGALAPVYAADVETNPAIAEVATAPLALNSADAEALSRELVGIGPSKAQAIVDYRTEHGPFTSVDELLEVKGIGAATLEKNRARLVLN